MKESLKIFNFAHHSKQVSKILKNLWWILKNSPLNKLQSNSLQILEKKIQMYDILGNSKKTSSKWELRFTNKLNLLIDIICSLLEIVGSLSF